MSAWWEWGVAACLAAVLGGRFDKGPQGPRKRDSPAGAEGQPPVVARVGDHLRRDPFGWAPRSPILGRFARETHGRRESRMRVLAHCRSLAVRYSTTARYPNWDAFRSRGRAPPLRGCAAKMVPLARPLGHQSAASPRLLRGIIPPPVGGDERSRFTCGAPLPRCAPRSAPTIIRCPTDDRVATLPSRGRRTAVRRGTG